MTEGYKPVFDKAEQEAAKINYSTTFSTFREHPELYHFIMAGQHQKYQPDDDALQQAYDINRDIALAMIDKGPTILGSGPSVIDGVESRQILLMTWLLHNLGTDLGDVVEYGGGYGNCLRLIEGIATYKSWTIVDLQHILDLQMWFLENSNINTDKVNFIGNNTILDLYPELVIGTHSLSEFSMQDFTRYFESIKHSKWLFYASHVTAPDRDLLQSKLRIIDTEFRRAYTRMYESDNSQMSLFENRSIYVR